MVTHSFAIVRRSAGWASLLALLVCCPSSARAHALVDEGRRLFEEAEFVGALDALGRAAAGDGMTRPELEELLELRALVHSALGDEGAVQADLRQLAAVAPHHEMGRGIPPDVQRAFTEIRASGTGSPRIVVAPETASSGVTIRASVENDWASVVRAVRIRGRAGAAGAFAQAVDAPLFVGTPTGEVVQYYAEAIGPGGAVLASVGSESEPAQAAGAATSGGGVDALPIALGIAGALVAVGIVVAVVVVTTSSSGQPATEVTPFTVRF